MDDTTTGKKVNPVYSQSRRKFLQTGALASASVFGIANLKAATIRADMSPVPLMQVLPSRNLTQLTLAPNQLPVSAQFKLGVASGDVSRENIILWTYYEGFFRLNIFVWQYDSKGDMKQVASAPVSRKDGGFVHIQITKLDSNTRYQYTFVEIDFEGRPIAQSMVGSFKTSMHPYARDIVTLGAVSCTNQAYEPTVLEHAGRRNDLDAFLLLGDTSYNDNVYTLQGIRDRWAINLAKRGYLALRSSTSVIATIDDHEIVDDFDPENIEPERFNAAMQAFFDHLPVTRNESAPQRVWRKLSFGQTVDVFVLDCRTERKPSSAYSDSPQYISREQMDWLKDGLSSSTAAFKLIINSVPITSFPQVLTADRWQGYPKQREEILAHIENQRMPGVLWLAGDFHFPCAGRVSTEGLGSRNIEILAGPGAQRPNVLGASLWLSPQFDYSSLSNNYVTLKFDPDSMEVEVNFNIAGSSPHHRDPEAVSIGFSKKYYLGTS